MLIDLLLDIFGKDIFIDYIFGNNKPKKFQINKYMDFELYRNYEFFNLIVDKEIYERRFSIFNTHVFADNNIKYLIITPLCEFRITKDLFKYSHKLKYVFIKPSVLSIEDNAFKGCKQLKKIKIPNTISHIGNYAFHGCSALEELSMSNNVKYIGTECFRSCTSLKRITLPENISLIRAGLFKNCSL